MTASYRIRRAIAVAGVITAVPGLASATLTGALTATITTGQPIQLSLLVTNTGGTDVTNVTAQAWTADAAAISAPTPSSTSWQTLYQGQEVTFTWTATPTAAGAVSFTATATAAEGDVAGPDTDGGTVAAAALDAYLAATATAGAPVMLTLTVTNTGGPLVSGVKAQAWTAGAAGVGGATPGTVAALAPGQAVTFAWTATPTAAGSITFSATASGDLAVSPVANVSPAVAAAAIDGQLTWSRTFANVGQGTQVMLTVSSTGGASLANVIPQISVLGPATVSVPVPLTAASVVAGQQRTFVWTITPTAGGMIAYTANASADGALVLPIKSGSLIASSAPLAGRLFAAIPGALWAGQNTVLSLTVSNVGGAAVGNPSTRVWGNLKGTGLPGAGFAASSKAVTSLGVNATVTFTWTITPSVAGLLTLTATASGDGGSYSPAVSLTVTVYAATAMRARLAAGKPGAPGTPVQFLMSLTNTGAVTIVNLSAQLWSDAPATVGAASPALVSSLVPGAQTTFLWTVVVPDARSMLFYAVANGFTTSATGAVATASDPVTAVLAGIPAPDAGKALVFPSPARNTATVAYTMAEGGNVVIRIYNEVGDLVATVEEVKSAGVQSSPLTTSGLAPGVYFCLVQKTYDSGATEKTGMRKFVVVH